MVCVVWLPTAPPVVGQCRRRSAFELALHLDFVALVAHLVKVDISGAIGASASSGRRGRRRGAFAFAVGLVIGGDAHLVRTVFSA